MGVIASTVGTSALLGAAAFLFRTQISHWLSKDLEKTKAGFQRELEAYKVSLIAESERAKARQEVKKAAALMVAEKRFAAINRLHQAVEGFATKMAQVIELEDKMSQEPLLKIANAAQKELMDAAIDGNIFLKPNQKAHILKLAEEFQWALMAKYPPINATKRAIAEIHYPKVFKLQAEVANMIAEHMNALAQMED